MRIKAFAFATMLAFMPTANACVNAVGTDHTGQKFEAGWYVGKDMTDPMFQQNQRNYWSSVATRTIQEARARPDFEHLTNLGVLLIYQGQYDLAIRHFLFVERRFPGHHETAANLGTALELAGHDTVALRWIRIGMRRNQHEHYGSEWLHARILQAKAALAKNPDYLDGRSVGGVTFEPTLVPPLPTATPAGNDGKPVKLWELNQALAYQLYERTQFVRPKDPVVANLLLDWATLNLVGGPIENADALYDAAVAYGATRDTLTRSRQSYIKRTLAQADGAKTEASEDICAICQPLPPPPSE
ncbi:tetratricopeptide (TPR) repeat protein [Lysobacter niastensis]|uniref:Tetratricopeptide (TPR) repeat protein n=1 Tax=Lysobacter niastensis TaxID=380629 RepID=A0ABU1W6P9_9GAMM|nr:tetratricopeptide repeat protein [Lysobacter niastensis]MDR7133272.1 tetratricopeptide (TPR) repeat protein [Lysobacter niastensis]